jgi:type VI secretion system protein ImpJ
VIALAPVWREGLLLTPQHLQQAGRAAEAALAAALRAVSPLGHGVVRLQHDPAALAAGSFRLLALEVVMPDGTPLRADGPEDLPPAMVLAERWPDGAQRATIHLVLPLPSQGGVDVSPDGLHEGRRTRWRTQVGELPDASGGRPRHVELQAPHLRLVIDGEDRDGHASLPIAELARPAADRFEFDAAIAPPCLRLDAAPALLACCRRLEELISARTNELSAHRRARARGLVEFAVSDIGAVLTLQALGRQLAVLRGRITAGWAHPAVVHEDLVALLGELTALAGEGDPGAAPAYDHQHPHRCFAAVEEALRPLLRAVVHTRYVPIPLQAVSERLHAGAIPEQATAGATYYLAVVSTLPAERVLREVPLRARVASQGRIDALVAAAMPGIRVVYVAVPPPEIPVQPGGAYFRLETSGDEWELASRTRSLAVFLPPELASARVEFLALKDNA